MGNNVVRKWYGEIYMGREARDDSSIASSRPTTSSPELQEAHVAPNAGTVNIAGAKIRDNIVVKEEEIDTLPGLSLAIEKKAPAIAPRSNRTIVSSIPEIPATVSASYVVKTVSSPTDSMDLEPLPGINTSETPSLCKQEPLPEHIPRNDGTKTPSHIDSALLRPSLHMSAHDFTEAKMIILDLLGWGVPPEYLIRCGLAREAIYYAFTELNLRLPTDFDTDGIIPYEPPSLLAATVI